METNHSWGSWLTLALVVALVIVGAIALGNWVRKRRQQVWRRFARRHGLTARRLGEKAFAVEGLVGERAIRLRSCEEGSDDADSGGLTVEMRVAVRSSIGHRLAIERADGVVGSAQHVLAEGQCQTGDEAFDRAFVMRADEPQFAQQLGASQRQALLDLLPTAPAELELADGWLVIRDRELVSRLDTLESRLERLLATARAFDVQSA